MNTCRDAYKASKTSPKTSIHDFHIVAHSGLVALAFTCGRAN
jgi:hypothetical protein